MTASSGSSSSSSSHSASLSFTVLRFASCHDCLRALTEGEGKTSNVLELFLESVRGAEVCALEGDGDRDERRGAARFMVCNDGADGDTNPLLIFPGASCCGGCRTAWLTGPFRLGYCGFLPVKSRKECWAGCESGVLRMLESDDDEMLRASYTTRWSGLVGMGKVFGPALMSSRLISSKCERSLGPM